MDFDETTGTETRFAAYADELALVLGHAERVGPFKDYRIGLLSAEGRKGVEPLAAVTAPERIAAQHQSLLHFVARAPWSDRAMLRRVRDCVLPSITRDEPIQAWIIDDTGFPKACPRARPEEGQPLGRRGPTVMRLVGQAGQLPEPAPAKAGVAVSLSVATHQGSLPIAYRLYLPKERTDDTEKTAGVPYDVHFQTKPEIALQQVRQALADGVPPGVVLMDPAYGNDSKRRAGISELGLAYVAGILPTTMVWRPGEAPLPPASRAGRGRPGKRLGRDATHRPVAAKTLAPELPADAWQQIKWRDGSNTPLTSRFARWRVRPAHDDARRSEPAAEEWLLMSGRRAQPNRFITGSARCPPTSRSSAWSIRPRCPSPSQGHGWRIERDYLELKQEVGLGHYEGRGWRGFHHHATLCVAAYEFLISEKEVPGLDPGIPPQDIPAPGEARNLPFPPVIDPEDLPLRSQRHMPNSIATLRIRLAQTLAHALPRCPCCGLMRPTANKQIE